MQASYAPAVCSPATSDHSARCTSVYRFAEDLDGYFAPDAPDWQEADEPKGMTLGGHSEFFRIEYWPARVAPSEKSGMIYMTVHYFY